MAILSSRWAKCTNCGQKMQVPNPKLAKALKVLCPNCNKGLIIPFETDETVINTSRSNGGSCLLVYNGETLPLREGRNVVGRMNSAHNASVELKTTDNSISREHCEIDVVSLNSGRVKAVISDIRTAEKIRKLPTKVGREPLEEEDKIVLSNGDVITMGHSSIKFIQE